jgi:hypothetical protein
MEPADADAYFGKVLRDAAKGTRLGRSQALRTYSLFLEIRHKIELHQLTGRVAECPVDEMNRPRGAGRAALRIPPSAVQVAALFAGWRAELATCRKFAPAARSYAAQAVHKACQSPPRTDAEPDGGFVMSHEHRTDEHRIGNLRACSAENAS